MFGLAAVHRAQDREGDVVFAGCLFEGGGWATRRGCAAARRFGGVFGLCAVVSQACGERLAGGLEDLRKIEEGIVVHGEEAASKDDAEGGSRGGKAAVLPLLAACFVVFEICLLWRTRKSRKKKTT